MGSEELLEFLIVSIFIGTGVYLLWYKKLSFGFDKPKILSERAVAVVLGSIFIVIGLISLLLFIFL